MYRTYCLVTAVSYKYLVLKFSANTRIYFENLTQYPEIRTCTYWLITLKWPSDFRIAWPFLNVETWSMF